MRWFGEPWPADWQTNGRAPVCEDDAERVEVPAGERCLWCSEPIEPADRGVVIPGLGGDQPTHLRCLIGQVLPEGYPLD